MVGCVGSKRNWLNVIKYCVYFFWRLPLANEKLEQKKVDPKSPTVIWVPSFMSGKDEVKPIHLRQFFFDNNIEYVRYD